MNTIQLEIHLFMACLTALSVAQTAYSRMITRLSNELVKQIFPVPTYTTVYYLGNFNYMLHSYS
jgi:hypothetical protein